MNPELPPEALAFGDTSQRALAGLGAVDAARRAEIDPSTRGEIRSTLDALGASELDPGTDADSAAAAAELCRAAGRVALPYPLVAILLADAGRPFAVVAGPGAARVDHADLFEEWKVATPDGSAWTALSDGDRLGSRLGPFVGSVRTRDPAAPAPVQVGLAMTLSAWQVLGGLERAVELAVEHVKGRVQFGQPIAQFQAVQFQLADAAVSVAGLRELCHFTLWRVTTAPDEAGLDVLALRMHALDVARSALRVTQQLHGAAGVCDEYDISVLCRHMQPALRLPFGSERTAEELAVRIEREGFTGLFPHGATAR